MITMEYGVYSGGILVALKGFDVHDDRPNAITADVIADTLGRACDSWPDAYWLPLDPTNLPKIGSPEPSRALVISNRPVTVKLVD